MDNVVLHKDCEKFVKARATNATDTSFASKVATLTEPSGDGVIDLRRLGASPNWLFLVPYGTGDANDVFDVAVIGWRRIGNLWVPTRLVVLTCTLGTATGASGAASTEVTNSELFADTITATMGISNVSYQLFSPADNTIAHALVSPDGCEKVELIFDTTTGDPPGANCLVARV